MNEITIIRVFSMTYNIAKKNRSFTDFALDVELQTIMADYRQ